MMELDAAGSVVFFKTIFEVADPDASMWVQTLLLI
jgi:hypothetical protein